MPEMQPIVIHTEDLNSYGYWVKTDGMDLSRWKKNPVMLWNHHRTWKGQDDEVLPIGIGADLKIEQGKIIVTPEFDMDDEFAAKIARKYEKGHIRAASIGVSIVELSEDPKHLKPGQRRATVTKSVLLEFSLTDIPANANAVRLYDDGGKMLTLSADGDAGVPLINLSDETKNEPMELKIIAAQLGLSDSAQLADIQNAITQLKAKAAQTDGLNAQLSELKNQVEATRKSEAAQLLSAAIEERRITADQRPHFEKLFQGDFDSAKSVLLSLPKVEKLNAQISPEVREAVVDGKYQGKTFSQWQKDDSKKLISLKASNFDVFNELYKAEFGKDYRK